MTPEQAIEGLEGEVAEAQDEGALKAVAYLQLGIEALEFYKREKASNISGIWSLLPGETEERAQ